MRTPSKNSGQAYTDRLADFENTLTECSHEDTMSPALSSAVREMLAEGGSASSDVREILDRRLANGELSQETYARTLKIVDRAVDYDFGMSPGGESESANDGYVKTQVIDQAEVKKPGAELQAADGGYVKTMVLDQAGVEQPVTEPDTAEDVFGQTVVLGQNDVPEPVQETETHVQVGTVLRDRFLLQEEAPGGSMGVVYKALDRRLAEVDSEAPYVAIKVLAPKLSRNGNALRALQQEAAKGRCLTHPNIVRFIDLDREGDLYFVVMEWLDGQSLAAILDQNSSSGLDQETALDIVRQVGRALAYAHRCGVVHADVKPANIIVTPADQAKLFDFGVARVRQKEMQGQPAFDPGVLNAQTAAYSSMQVISGEDPEPSDDIFSLGCLMYRLLAGYRVFGPRNAAEAADAGMNPQRPQGISDTQWAALRKALSFSRVTRFTSIDEFLEALDRQSETPEPLPEPELIVPKPEFEVESRRLPWSFILMLIVVLVAVALVSQDGLLRQLGISELTMPGATQVADLETPAATPATEDNELFERQRQVEIESAPVRPEIQSVRPAPPPAETTVRPKAAYEPVDFALLPPADVVMEMVEPGAPIVESQLVLREDAGAAIVDLVRSHNLHEGLSVNLVQIHSTGNRSPMESGQFRMEDDGVVLFQPGQKRARTTILMTSDPLREPDQEVNLVVSKVGDDSQRYAALNLDLEDDDQRAFELSLPPNTVGFAVSQVSVREEEPAVQVDVLRFRPDNTRLDIEYSVRDITATQGKDYFSAATNTVSFEPGQRNARILIPLVQDTTPESDEAFALELLTVNPGDDRDVFLRIAVMIRDDDS